MSKSDKKDITTLWIVIIIVIAVIAFVLTLGYIKPKKSTEHYAKIDFGKIPKDIEKYIRQLEEELKTLKNKEESLKKRVNRKINWLKALVSFIFILFHVLMLCFSEKYGLNEFIQWNEAFLLVTLFVLFMISEKYSNINNGFNSLKTWIHQLVFEKANFNPKDKVILIERLKILSAINDIHPSIIINYKKNQVI